MVGRRHLASLFLRFVMTRGNSIFFHRSLLYYFVVSPVILAVDHIPLPVFLLFILPEWNMKVGSQESSMWMSTVL